MIRNASVFMAGLAMAFFTFVGTVNAGDCGGSKAKTAKYGKNIVETAVSAGNFETLVAAAGAAGLAEALQGDGPLTVFAPTDKAFGKLPKGTVESLLANPSKLRAILKYHVVPGKVMAADVMKIDKATTLNGYTLDVNTKDGVRIGNANVIATDVKASNGVIHVIDTVLLPPDDIVDVASKAGKFNTLLAAAEAAGLVDTLREAGPYTVFAPTDEAFAALGEDTIESLLEHPAKLRSILLYHVVPGKVMAKDVVKLEEAKTAQGSKVSIDTSDGVRIDDAKVVKTDIETGNGVIHVIDTVILPQSRMGS